MAVLPHLLEVLAHGRWDMPRLRGEMAVHFRPRARVLFDEIRLTERRNLHIGTMLAYGSRTTISTDKY
jgi:hypothetical protein